MKLRLILFAVLLLPFSPVSAQQAKALSTLKKALNEELEGNLFRHTLAAIEIADAASGTVLYARNESMLLRPASNAKLFTSAAAVLGLPPGAHFETRLIAFDSSMRTIVCIGGGDPLFREQDIQKLAEIALEAGVRRIDTLLFDGSLYDDDYFGKGWMWDDEADPFMPYLCAFPFENNTVTLRVRKSTKHLAGYEVTTFPSSAIFRIRSSETDREEAPFRIERLPRSNDFIIHGVPPGGSGKSERFSVWKPQQLFAERLQQVLALRGLTSDSLVVFFSQDIPALQAGTSPLSIGSVRRPLDEVLAAMNKESDNLCAEAVLRMLSYGTGRKKTAVSAGDGIKAMESIFGKNGIATGDIALLDGSGVSFYNLVTAAATGRVLRAIAASPAYERYQASLSIGGVDGTLRRRMNGLASSKYFQGKTGTVRGVSALSGYVQAPGGRLLTVVIYMQNFIGKHAPYRDAQDRLVTRCLEYSASFSAVRQPR